MISKKKLVKKIFISIVVVGLLFSLAYFSSANEIKIKNISFNEAVRYVSNISYNISFVNNSNVSNLNNGSNIINNINNSVYEIKTIDYNERIPACNNTGNSQNQKNNVPPHLKRCGLNGTCFLDDPKLKPVSYDPILKKGVLIYGHKRTIILRLDDVKAWQYYDITVNMTSLILSKNMTVTMAVIPKDIEKDNKLFLPWINNMKNNPLVEIALHGYLHDGAEFKNLTEDEALDKIKMGKEALFNYTGVIPVTFIPPQNEYSKGTIEALSSQGFRVIAASSSKNMPQYYQIGENLSYIGYTSQTYYFPSNQFVPAQKVLENCKSSLNKNGLCVIMIHPQDYLTSDRKHIDEARYAEFVKLLDGLKNLNASFRNFKDVAECKP